VVCRDFFNDIGGIVVGGSLTKMIIQEQRRTDLKGGELTIEKNEKA